MAVPRLALWRLLVERGLAETEQAARALCLSGEVLLDGARADKPGTLVKAVALVSLRRQRGYASRGGEKLAYALERFGVGVQGRIALDCGASTGGFTDCLLQRGAARVYAVDVGYGQLLGRLRQDPRVVNLERTNLGAVGRHCLDPLPSVVTLDLSYLPLAEAWRLVARWLPEGADVISLVKPLFEVDDAVARRSGVLVGPAPYRNLLSRLVATCGDMRWSACGVAASPIQGHAGTLEFLLYARASSGLASACAAAEIEHVVQNGMCAVGATWPS